MCSKHLWLSPMRLLLIALLAYTAYMLPVLQVYAWIELLLAALILSLDTLLRIIPAPRPVYWTLQVLLTFLAVKFSWLLFPTIFD